MSEKTVSIALSAELADIMRSAVIDRCGQLQGDERHLRSHQMAAEYAGYTYLVNEYKAILKNTQTQLAGLREIYRILETARLGGTEDTEEEDMIRMEASKPVLSRKDYLDIYRYLRFVRETYLETAENATKQKRHGATSFCTNRANHIAELLGKVAREAGLDELDEKEGASVSRMVVNAAKKTPPPEAETPETAKQLSQ